MYMRCNAVQQRCMASTSTLPVEPNSLEVDEPEKHDSAFRAILLAGCVVPPTVQPVHLWKLRIAAWITFGGREGYVRVVV